MMNSGSKPKRIVITPEDVANAPMRRAPPRKPQKQILDVAPGATPTEESANSVTLIHVNDLGEVSTIDGSLLGQDIAIQIADEELPAGATVLDSVATEVEDEDDPEVGYIIQSPENYQREMLEMIQFNLTKKSEKYADLAVFCSDGIVWSSKLLLASASIFAKELLLDVPSCDDTCIVLPNMTKAEFLAFQNALFSKEDTQPADMFSFIKGCELFLIDVGMTTEANLNEEPPLVEYSNLFANPFEKKRVLHSLGYIPSEGYTDSSVSKLDANSNYKSIGQVLKVLEDNVKCEECHRSFFDVSALESHQKIIHASYSIDKLVRNKHEYKCTHCNRTFAFAVNLKKHFWFCHSSSGGELKMKAAQNAILPMLMPSKEEKLSEKFDDMKCSLCGKICTNWKNLEIHMLAHTNETPFKCEICGRGFRDDQKLKRHGVVHTKEKNFACSVCGKKFGLKHNMVVHERMHKGQGRKCEYCSRVFTQPSTLKNHMLIHKQKKHVKTDDPALREKQIVKASKGRPSIDVVSAS